VEHRGGVSWPGRKRARIFHREIRSRTGRGRQFSIVHQGRGVLVSETRTAFGGEPVQFRANVGPIIAPAVVPFIAAEFGWRMVFVVAGLAGFLWLALWIPFYSAPEKEPLRLRSRTAISSATGTSRAIPPACELVETVYLSRDVGLRADQIS